MSDLNMWEIEEKYYAQSIELICGVDEAGRGPLAGPVCAAAVILPPHAHIEGLNDSKKLSDKRRRELMPVIKEQAIAYAIAMVDHDLIDKINILQATYQAMGMAIRQLPIKPVIALIDGNRADDFGVAVETVVKGDSRSASIAAASILAKVYRDRLMKEYDALYPEYGFAKNKGYGTKQHMQAIEQYGITPIHRKSFAPAAFSQQKLF